MREGEREQQYEDHGAADHAAAGEMSHGERRPEQRVRYPHFGRKAEHQRADAGGREACNKMVRRLERSAANVAMSSRELRREKKKSVNRDAAGGVAGQRDKCLGGHETDEINRQTSRDVVPMHRPRILHGNGVGKHGAVAVELQAVAQPRVDEQERPGAPRRRSRRIGAGRSRPG